MPQRRGSNPKTLDRRYYISPEVYQLESERIFDQQWLCVGRVDEVAEPGNFVLVEIEGESLILLRDQNGDVRCFYNVCRHRGARVCEQQRGSVAGSLRCPYHSWTYDLAGKLIAAPFMDDSSDFSKSDYSLQNVAAATWEGFVFVNLSGDPPAFEQSYAALQGKFTAWSLPELVSAGPLTYTVQANWKLLFQNYSECYHCPRVHPALNALSDYRTATNDLLSGPFLGGPMQLADGVESMSTDGKACGPMLPGLADPDRRRVYYYTLFPTMFLSLHPDYVLVHRLQRLSVDTTQVTCDLLFPKEASQDHQFDPRPAIEFWDQTNLQDWHVCELSQQGASSRSHRPGPYTSLESTVAQFDEHYLAAMG